MKVPGQNCRSEGNPQRLMRIARNELPKQIFRREIGSVGEGIRPAADQNQVGLRNEAVRKLLHVLFSTLYPKVTFTIEKYQNLP